MTSCLMRGWRRHFSLWPKPGLCCMPGFFEKALRPSGISYMHTGARQRDSLGSASLFDTSGPYSPILAGRKAFYPEDSRCVPSFGAYMTIPAGG